jgi:hypothetical protein
MLQKVALRIQCFSCCARNSNIFSCDVVKTKYQYHPSNMPITSLPDMIKYTGDQRPKTNEVHQDFLGDFKTSRRLQKQFRDAVYHAYTQKNCERTSVHEYTPISRKEAKKLAQSVTEDEKLETLANGKRRVKSPLPRKRRGAKPKKEDMEESDSETSQELSDLNSNSESELETSDSSEDETPVVRRRSPRRSKRRSRK